MSALTFLGTYLLRIDFAIPGGRVMIHFGTTFCIISAILFGGMCGGLSGGIGMAMFDLSSGTFVAYAPFTFILKFVVGFVCGKIASVPAKITTTTDQNPQHTTKYGIYTGAKTSSKYTSVAIISAVLINVIGSPLINITIKVLIYGLEIQTALLTAWISFIAALINGVITTIICIPLAKFIKNFS